MANRIIIDTNKLDAISQKLQYLSFSLNDLANKISSLSLTQNTGGNVHVQLSSVNLYTTGKSIHSGSVEECLSFLSSNLYDIQDFIANLSSSIASSSERFIQLENHLMILSDALPDPISISDLLALSDSPLQFLFPDQFPSSFYFRDGHFIWSNPRELFFNSPTFSLFRTNSLIDTLISYTVDDTDGKITETYTRLSPNKFLSYLKDERKSGFLDAEIEKNDIIESNQNSLHCSKNKENLDGKKHELIKFGTEHTTEHSIWGLSGNLEGEKGKVSSSFRVGNFDTTSSFAGGFGIFNQKGKKNPSLYAGGYIDEGISFSAINAKVSGEYELIDNVKFGGDMETSFLSGSIAGDGGIGFIDSKFVAYGEVEAELNLAETKGKAYVDVAGVKGSVGGSVNIGIGAHAKAGYHDGKVSIDIGAGIGIGISVNCELDIGGLVENIGDGLDEIGQQIDEGLDDLGNTISHVGDAVQTLGDNIISWFGG